jgi:aarF domain-containing kinase
MVDIPKSRWARGGKLLQLATKVAVQELSARVGGRLQEEADKLRLRVEQTTEIVKTLNQMKGAAMKAGQLLSLEATDLLPPEILQVLSQLQSSQGQLKGSEVKALLEQELGSGWTNKIENFEDTPFAAASIGQVHKARYQGKEIVLKIQYPGVSESIDSDVDLLASLLNKLNFVLGKDIPLDPVLDEIKETLKQETNYLLEAEFTAKYRESFQNFPGYVLPHSFPEISTKKILALEYISGVPLRDWIKERRNKEETHLIAQKLMHMYLHEFFNCGFVQTDPNLTNFLVQTNLSLVILDFGACKTYSKEFRQAYREVLKATLEERDHDLLELSYSFELLDPREAKETKDLYLSMMKVISSPFKTEEPFSFSDTNFAEESREITLRFAKKLQFSPPPKKLIFLHRKLGGLFQILKRLEAELDLKEISHNYIYKH